MDIDHDNVSESYEDDDITPLSHNNPITTSPTGPKSSGKPLSKYPIHQNKELSIILL